MPAIEPTPILPANVRLNNFNVLLFSLPSFFLNTFIIGGSYGLDEEIKSLSNYRLSFSKMTFPHQLFRLILLEQIYKAYKINHNEEYHK